MYLRLAAVARALRLAAIPTTPLPEMKTKSWTRPQSQQAILYRLPLGTLKPSPSFRCLYRTSLLVVRKDLALCFYDFQQGGNLFVAHLTTDEYPRVLAGRQLNS